MDRLQRQLHEDFVVNPRPAGSPLMTWGRALKKALIRCGQSPSFAVWRQAAADRMFWSQMCVRFAPSPPPEAGKLRRPSPPDHPRPPAPSWHPSRPVHYPGIPPTPSPPSSPPHQLRPQRCLRPQPRPSDGPRTAPCVGPVLKERPTTSSSRRRIKSVGGAAARIAVLGSGNLDPGVYPAVGSCSNSN